MRQTILVLGFLLSFSAGAAAQGPFGVGAGSRSESSSSTPLLDTWHFSVGYQYNEINLTGTPFETKGISGSLVRFFGRWIGVEGQMGYGWGNTQSTTYPSNLSVKSLFAAAGPRLGFRRYRLEPWVHGLVGVEHFRFSQTAGLLGSNTGVAGSLGGGLDFRLTRSVTLSGGADEIGTHFFNGYQRHFQAVGGVVYRFY